MFVQELQNVDSIVTNEVSIVYEVARTYLGDISAKGYSVRSVKVECKEQIPPCLSILFLNRKIFLELDISFFPARNGGNGAFLCRISKSNGQHLRVEDYLKIHGRHDLLPYFTYLDPKTDIATFANDFFKMLLALFHSDMKSIIEGKTFEETPIDWLSYK
jgi:hypothetical protein